MDNKITNIRDNGSNTQDNFKVVIDSEIDIDKQTVYLDVDDVIINSSEVVVDILNQKYRIPHYLKPKTVQDVHSWDYKSIGRNFNLDDVNDIFCSDEFWSKIEFVPSFLNLLSKLSIESENSLFNRYNWILVTKGDTMNLIKKHSFIFNHPSVVPVRDKIGMYGLGLNGNKDSIRMLGGIQIDDNYDNLIHTDARLKILVTNGLETDYNAHYRIKDNLKNLYVVNSFEEALDILTFNLEVKL